MTMERWSEWIKWDLHIHTPNTKLNNSFTSEEEFIKKINESDIKVFWITDYFSFNKEEFNELQKIKWKIFFPNIEFRIDQKNKDWEFINIHLLFNNTKSIIDEIPNFLNRLSLFNEDNLDWTKYYCSNLWDKLSYDKAILKLDDLKEQVSNDFSKMNYIIVWAPNWYWWFRPWDDTRWEEYAKWIDKISKIFLDSSENFDNANINKEFFLDENRFEWAIKKPLLFSSDSHSEENIWSKFTWIKANPTFEWLKQVIFEPEERIYIWEKPANNLNKIEEIELKFNNNIKIKTNENSNEYAFCFSNVKEKLYLSDYFNCFIWWRWSWKSSLLNLIYSNITWKKDTNFLENNDFSWLNIENDLEINYKWDIEFLWQNQIEEFATDYVKFSKAIYKRLENKVELENSSIELEDYIISLNDYISNIKDIEKNQNDLKELEKKLKNYESIIEVVKWDEYNKIKEELDNLSKNYYWIEQSKERYNNLYESFDTFIKNYSKIYDENNSYDKEYNKIFSNLEKINENILKNDFSNIEKEQKEIYEKWKEQKEKLNNYLKEKWLSEEKLKNLEEAQEWLHKWKIEQENINDILKKYLELHEKLSIDEWKLTYDWYVLLIEEWLKKAEEKLNSIKNDNIKKFEFKVGFNLSQAKKDLLDDLINDTFKDYKKSWLRSDIIEESLFKEEVNLFKILDWTIEYKKFIDYINKLDWRNNEFLKEIFELESNFIIYRVVIAKYLYNLDRYLKIEILYDWRPIENSSFWQKCTVVILIMLLFWNNPIIIDEPEAHLDSLLIADYLVDLIKQRKKERQIIFATHNANFVINWDAEQIYILENNDNKTNFTQTSIENLANRDKLLNLEWWKTAFNLRWEKYS